MNQQPTILAISAHAADFCSRAGGTLAKYARRGSHVHVLDLTFGERGESGGYWSSVEHGTVRDAKDVRKKEAQSAAAVLGVDIEFMDWDDYPLMIDRERITTLAAKIKEVRPQVVLTHWQQDPFNVDHYHTSHAVIRACSCASVAGVIPDLPRVVRPDIFFFEASIPPTEFNGFRPDTFINISEEFTTKMAALKELKSQPFLTDWYTRYADYRGFQVAEWFKTDIRYAEGFVRYTPYVGDEFSITTKGV